MKIVIDDKIPFIRGTFEPFAEVVYAPGRSIDARLVADADALIVRTRTQCNRSLLESSRVKIVASATIGFDHIDIDWLNENGIRWANAPGCNSGSVMQYLTSLLFFLAEKHSLDLPSLTLGIAGVGNVGSKVERAARALGMRVLLNDPPRQRREESRGLQTEGYRRGTKTHDSDLFTGAGRGGTEFHPLRTLLTDCDIITLHVPLTREGRDKTYHLLELHNLSEMKKDALLINTSRGEVVDNIALRESLEKGLLRGASLDVWEGEPVADPRLIAMADIATPHIAGYSVDGKANATISSVRVVAETLGIPLEHWTPAELPAPEAPVIDLSGLNDNSLDLVARAVWHTYPIAGDDTLFRKEREKFEYLRDNYRIRREFGSYSVRTDDSRAAQIMKDLGFKIIK